MECELKKRTGSDLSAAGAVRSQVFESGESSTKTLMCKAIIYRSNFDIIWCRILGGKEEGDTNN